MSDSLNLRRIKAYHNAIHQLVTQYQDDIYVVEPLVKELLVYLPIEFKQAAIPEPLDVFFTNIDSRIEGFLSAVKAEVLLLEPQSRWETTLWVLYCFILLLLAGFISIAISFNSFKPGDWALFWPRDFELIDATQSWGTLGDRVSVDGKALMVGGHRYSRGYGTHANSKISIGFKDKRFFSGTCGLDQEVSPKGSIECTVTTNDNQVLWSSGVLSNDEFAPFRVEVSGMTSLTLKVSDGGDGMGDDHADWVNLRFQ